MRTLGWIRRFRQSSDEQSRNVSTRKTYSCFSALWKLDEQQNYPEANNKYARFMESRTCLKSSNALEARGVEEERAEMSPGFFYGFLAIGTLGSVPITNEDITAKAVMPFEIATEEDTSATDVEMQCLNKKSKNLSKKDIKENKNMEYSQKENSEMPETKEEAKEQKVTPENLFKSNATIYKISGKSEKESKRETHGSHFMKKMLKKINFTSRCNTTSAGRNAIFSDSAEGKPIKVVQRSRKIYPEADEVHITKLHNYEVKKMSKDEGYHIELTLKDEEIMYTKAGMFANKAINSQPGREKARWIKTDADYFVLEF